MIGQTISHYHILEKLGEGGMGVVYKAEDTTLDRIVALKFLPSHPASSEQDKARFIQEAKAASALNHPNVCTIHAIEELEGQLFIAMEFVDGQTLREKRGSVNFKQGIDIGIQIADGLAAAHEKGIVHRDIKPENIMIRKDGIAQIMDFGLAKLRSSGSKITRLTKEGSTIGTAGYMSPEQVQGQDTDHRSDIFSFGVLLYELLAGQLPFKGVHETALAYEIVNVDPLPMSAVKPEIDPNLDAIILQCLEKDPRERNQSVAQVSLDLKRYRRESSRMKMSRVTAARPAIKVQHSAEGEARLGRSRQNNFGYILSGVLAMALIVLLWTPWKKEANTSRPGVRFSIDLPADAPLRGAWSGSGIAVSPDGKCFAYRVKISNGTQIYLHWMDRLTVEPIPGTENADDISFSPDGKWILYSVANQKLAKVSISGGAPEVLCPIPTQTRGTSWSSDNTVLFGLVNDGIFGVSSSGGTPYPVTVLDSTAGEISHRFPQVLPDGKTVIFTVKNNSITTFDDAVIVAQRIDNGERKVLIRGGSYAKYIPTGYLTYMRGNAILAVPFDADRLEVRGTAVQVQEGGWFLQGAGNAHMDFSTDGMLVFAPAGAQSGSVSTLAWMARDGALRPLYDSLKPYTAAIISPDGQKIALGINAANNDIWVYQIPRGVLSRITFGGGNNGYPIWSPDGKYVVYSAEKGKSQNIFRKVWDGSGDEERLTTSQNIQFAVSISPDGKTLCYNEKDDIRILPMEGERKPVAFIHTPAAEADGLFSPNGRWIAYSSNETGKREVYVTSFPEHQGKWQVSNGGGVAPLWSSNGKELFFFNGASVMGVDVRPTTTFDFSVPRKICEAPVGVVVQDISADGKQFLVTVSQTQRLELPKIEVVTGWFDIVKSKFAGNKN